MKYHSKRERERPCTWDFFLMKTIEIKNIIMFKKEKKKKHPHWMGTVVEQRLEIINWEQIMEFSQSEQQRKK